MIANPTAVVVAPEGNGYAKVAQVGQDKADADEPITEIACERESGDEAVRDVVATVPSKDG